MHIKRFEAPTMLEAVQKVKAELGPDALVLSTRTLRRHGGAFGLFARAAVEVTAAVDRDVRAAGAPKRAERVRADDSWQGLQLARALVDPLEAEVRALRGAVERTRPVPDAGPLAARLEELQRTTADLAQRVLPAGREGGQLCGALLAAGLAPRHAFALGEEAARDAGAGARPALRGVLARRLDALLAPPRSDDPAPVALFVGPTGVGKTTTLAKIAAREQGAGEEVRVLTTDTYRIGAEEQLRTFAGLLRVPFGVAASAGELLERVAAPGGRRILVDTAGRSRRDPGPLAELARVRERLGARARVHLVLSATTKDADLHREVHHYASLRPDSLIVTKVDESDDLGNVANLLLDADSPPLAWLATGQRVPEDLEVPDPEQLARRVLGAAP